MGLNIEYVNSSNQISGIDSEALARVKQQILNPDNTINTAKVDLSKFNRVSLGTDLYSSRTNGETALQAAKAATDFDVNLSDEFSSNVQYLNSQAAQSLFSSKEINETQAVSIENTDVTEEQIVTAASQTIAAQDMNNDRNGSNPFSFYVPSDITDGNEETNYSIS